MRFLGLRRGASALPTCTAVCTRGKGTRCLEESRLQRTTKSTIDALSGAENLVQKLFIRLCIARPSSVYTLYARASFLPLTFAQAARTCPGQDAQPGIRSSGVCMTSFRLLFEEEQEISTHVARDKS